MPLRMLWTFVLVFGWTFIPGQIAFDQAAVNSFLGRVSGDAMVDFSRVFKDFLRIS